MLGGGRGAEIIQSEWYPKHAVDSTLPGSCSLLSLRLLH